MFSQIFEGSTNNDDQLIGQYCGSTVPRYVTSLTNVLTVRFISDKNFSKRGFILTYQLLCGGDFDYDHGVISSPNYPEPYEMHSKF